MDVRKETMENDMPKLVSALSPRLSSCVDTDAAGISANSKCGAAAQAVRRMRRCLTSVSTRGSAQQAQSAPERARRCCCGLWKRTLHAPAAQRETPRCAACDRAHLFVSQLRQQRLIGSLHRVRHGACGNRGWDCWRTAAQRRARQAAQAPCGRLQRVCTARARSWTRGGGGSEN